MTLEEIGYVLHHESDKCLDYQMKNMQPDSKHVLFNLLDRSYFYEEYDEVGNIEIELHIAIHQRMKELGWLDDHDTTIATAVLINENGEPLLPRGEVLCSACGERIYETDKFCKHCGRSLDRSDEAKDKAEGPFERFKEFIKNEVDNWSDPVWNEQNVKDVNAVINVYQQFIDYRLTREEIGAVLACMSYYHLRNGEQTMTGVKVGFGEPLYNKLLKQKGMLEEKK